MLLDPLAQERGRVALLFGVVSFSNPPFTAMQLRQQVLSQVEQGKEEAGQIVDARSLARFRGEAPEPRAGLAAGHVPGSVSLPFTKVLEEGDVTK